MSRVGKKPVKIPDGVEVHIEGNTIKVKGPKGELQTTFHRDMKVVQGDGEVRVERPSDERLHRSLHGLTRTLIANLMEGVTKGFQKTLELVGTGYRASKSGNKLMLSVGYSHPVEVDPPAGIEIEVPSPTVVVVKGSDKQLVGEVAASIRSIRKAEPYLGKGIRYQGERVRRKVGKAGRK